MFTPALFLASFGHHPLHLVEQVFGNEWLVFSFVELATELQHPVVGGATENLLNRGEMQVVAFPATQPLFLQPPCQRLKGVLPGGVQLKGLADEWCALRVN